MLEPVCPDGEVVSWLKGQIGIKTALKPFSNIDATDRPDDFESAESVQLAVALMLAWQSFPRNSTLTELRNTWAHPKRSPRQLRTYIDALFAKSPDYQFLTLLLDKK